MRLPLARTEEILVQDIAEETLAYDLKTNQVYCLNQAAGVVYRACVANASFEELKLEHKFTDEIIFLALDQLKRANLLAVDSNYSSPLIGMSRREVIKRFGLVSIAALPLITSIIAPSSAAAQSGGLPGPGGPGPGGPGPGGPTSTTTTTTTTRPTTTTSTTTTSTSTTLPKKENFTRCRTSGECASGYCVSTPFLPVGSFCCPPGNGGTQKGPIGTAIGLECFSSCSQDAAKVCCSGKAESTSCGNDPFCASQQQFCCACV